MNIFLSPSKNEKFFSIDELRKKYKLSEDIKNFVNKKSPLMDKINEQSYDNYSERSKIPNKKNNFNLSSASVIEKKLSFDYNKQKNNNLETNLEKEKNDINKCKNAFEKNYTNLKEINDNEELSYNYSLNNKMLKSILKNNQNELKIKIPTLNLLNSSIKGLKRVSIEDEILPTCLKTKSLSILSLSNFNYKVILKYFF